MRLAGPDEFPNSDTDPSMRRRIGLLPLAFFLAACAAGPGPDPTPPPPSSDGATAARAPEPRNASAGPAPTPTPEAAEPRLEAAPDAWQLLDLERDRVPGVSADRAYRELLAGREPARTVVVAVIDGGTDTAHVDLRDRLWRNEDEIAGNGIDDDGNGYVDDVYGWNFIGGPDGRNVRHETLEVTRLLARCDGGETSPSGISCQTVRRAYDEERTEVEQTLANIERIDEALSFALPLLREATGSEELTVESVEALSPTDGALQQARSIFLQLDAAGITPKIVEEAKESFSGLLEYGLDPAFRGRDVVGDDIADGTQRVYGNHDVMGPDASHGTHVAGIIGAVRDNGVGIDGIAPAVALMTVRAVPDGDERDKDVANAIRYAVDNGAHIINMSFGKSFSPSKSLVDAAVRYADENGVLMVHAAGNDGEDIEAADNFPTREYDGGGRAEHWIEVGAAAWQVDSLAATFSNYGRTKVDVFAPGVDILSTLPHDEFERQDGTSMAAPVVTGVAALLMAYFPELDAAEVKRILLESAVGYGERVVPQPGTGDPVPFGSMSVTGGVVNAYEAVRMAMERM